MVIVDVVLFICWEQIYPLIVLCVSDVRTILFHETELISVNVLHVSNV